MRENWTRSQDNRLALPSSATHPGWSAVVTRDPSGLWTFTITQARRRYTWHPFQGFTEVKQAKHQAIKWINWIATTENRLK